MSGALGQTDKGGSAKADQHVDQRIEWPAAGAEVERPRTSVPAIEDDIMDIRWQWPTTASSAVKESKLGMRECFIGELRC